MKGEKGMTKKILSVFFAVVLLVGTTISSSALVSASNDLTALENDVPIEVRRAMENQTEALECYQKLYDSFVKDEMGMPIYPDEYAGAYIEDGKLMIQLADNSENIQNKYVLLCGDSDKIDFIEAEYSMNELLSYESYVKDMLDDGYDVIRFGVCEKENIFEIIVNVNADAPVASLSVQEKDSIELPIKIMYQEPIISCAEMWGGDELRNEDTEGTMSVGICGSYDGKNALLTCGHGNEQVGIISKRYPYIAYFSSRIGQVSYQRANTSSNAQGVETLGDFAIVTLNSNATPTNRVHGGINITGTYSSLPEGTTIYKYGKTSGLSYGTITRVGSTSVTSYSDGLFTTYYVRGLYQSSMRNSSGTDAISPGDSGGTVYIKSGSEYLLHGIVTARREPTSGPASVMFSSPIYYAEDAGFTVRTY